MFDNKSIFDSRVINKDDVYQGIHDIWAFAKENESLCSDGYDKKAFNHVLWWLSEYNKHNKETSIDLSDFKKY